MNESDLTKLRIRVAELCGWTNLKLFSYANGDRISGLRGVASDCSGNYRSTVPDYPNDLNAAMQLCDVLKEEGWSVVIFRVSAETGWHVSMSKRNEEQEHSGWSTSLSSAICEAFVAVMEGRHKKTLPTLGPGLPGDQGYQ